MASFLAFVLLTLALLTLFISSFVYADTDLWRPSTLSTTIIPVLSTNQAPEPTPRTPTPPSIHSGLFHTISETRPVPSVTLSGGLPIPPPVPNGMTAPLSNPSQAPQLRPEETDHIKLIATPKPRGEPLDPQSSEHTCAKNAEVALAEWRYYCRKPHLAMLGPWCWNRAPSVKRCCTKGKKPAHTCSWYLPTAKGKEHEGGR